MSYTPNIPLELDPVYTGMAADLRAQLYDGATASTVGSEMSGGFTELPGAEAKYVYRPTIPDGHDGWCQIYPDGQPEITIGYFVINPSEIELVNLLTTVRHDQLTGALSTTPTIPEILVWIGMLAKNLIIETSTFTTLRNEDDTVDVATSAISDDGTTFVRGQWS